MVVKGPPVVDAGQGVGQAHGHHLFGVFLDQGDQFREPAPDGAEHAVHVAAVFHGPDRDVLQLAHAALVAKQRVLELLDQGGGLLQGLGQGPVPGSGQDALVGLYDLAEFRLGKVLGLEDLHDQGLELLLLLVVEKVVVLDAAHVEDEAAPLGIAGHPHPVQHGADLIRAGAARRHSV